MGRTYRYDKQNKSSWQPAEEIVCRCGSPKCTWCENARMYTPQANTHGSQNFGRNDQWPTDDFEDWDE